TRLRCQLRLDKNYERLQAVVPRRSSYALKAVGLGMAKLPKRRRSRFIPPHVVVLLALLTLLADWPAVAQIRPLPRREPLPLPQPLPRPQQLPDPLPQPLPEPGRDLGAPGPGSGPDGARPNFVIVPIPCGFDEASIPCRIAETLDAIEFASELEKLTTGI